MKPVMMRPEDLSPNPWNSNNVDPQNMEKLKNSISELGFSSAVVAREIDGETQILGGQHRTQAAIELGIEEIPVLILEDIDDAHAMKIGLVDNSRYGTDDALALADIFEAVQFTKEEISALLPYGDDEIDQVFHAVNVNLDELDLLVDDADEESLDDDEQPTERTAPTHTNMRFRVTNANAEAISRIIEKTISREKISDGDDATNAGSALAHILLNDL